MTSPIVREVRIGPHRLIQGDCLDVLPLLEPVCAVVTDPPYGIGESAKKNRRRENKAKPGAYADSFWDDKPCPPEAIAMMRDISRYQIIFGGNYFEGLGPTSCWLIWDKLNTGDFADCEMAWTNLPKAIRRIQWLWNGMIRKGDDVREHETQKPEGVMRWCLTHIPEAKVILDPFAGSGTTIVACVKEGRHGIGIEREPHHFETMVRRVTQAFEEAHRQPDLLAPTLPPAPVQEVLL